MLEDVRIRVMFLSFSSLESVDFLFSGFFFRSDGIFLLRFLPLQKRPDQHGYTALD